MYVDDGHLVVEGAARNEEHDSASLKYLKRERKDGRFRRVFRLTQRSNSDAIYSHVRDGVLTVVVPKALPKQEAAKSQEA